MEMVGRAETSLAQGRSNGRRPRAESNGAAGFSLADLRNGQNEAWSSVVYELGGPLRAFIAVRGANDVDGTLGDVFLDMSRNIGGFEGGWSDLRSWAFTIARRRVIDDHRYFNRRPTEFVEPSRLGHIERFSGDSEEDAMTSLATGSMLRLLDRLTPVQREVIFLRFFLALTAPEVASITGSSVTAVRANQRRAIRKLKHWIDSPIAGDNETLLDVTG